MKIYSQPDTVAGMSIFLYRLISAVLLFLIYCKYDGSLFQYLIKEFSFYKLIPLSVIMLAVWVVIPAFYTYVFCTNFILHNNRTLECLSSFFTYQRVITLQLDEIDCFKTHPTLNRISILMKDKRKYIFWCLNLHEGNYNYINPSYSELISDLIDHGVKLGTTDFK